MPGILSVVEVSIEPSSSSPRGGPPPWGPIATARAPSWLLALRSVTELKRFNIDSFQSIAPGSGRVKTQRGAGIPRVRHRTSRKLGVPHPEPVQRADRARPVALPSLSAAPPRGSPERLREPLRSVIARAPPALDRRAFVAVVRCAPVLGPCTGAERTIATPPPGPVQGDALQPSRGRARARTRTRARERAGCSVAPPLTARGEQAGGPHRLMATVRCAPVFGPCTGAQRTTAELRRRCGVRGRGAPRRRRPGGISPRALRVSPRAPRASPRAPRARSRRARPWRPRPRACASRRAGRGSRRPAPSGRWAGRSA